MSAKSDREGKKDALLAAFLIPPLGIAGIMIGLFMRSHYILSSEVDALIAKGMSVPHLPVLQGTIQVFPSFLINHLNPLVAGIIIGTLLVSVVGGGAGLSFGMATIMVKNIISKISKQQASAVYELIATRVTIVSILVIAAVVSLVSSDTVINDYGFLSMGLRGAVVFIPLTTALFMKNKINPKFILASIVISPIAVVVGEMIHTKVDSLFIGVFISIVITGLGYFFKGDTNNIDV